MTASGEPTELEVEVVDDIIDDINRHLGEAGDFDRAALIPGMYLAWCARLNLLERGFAEQQAQAILRLHYNDGSCIEMLVAGCAGTLKYSHLNSQGAAFARNYYSTYLADWQTLFGEDIYAVEDSWENYAKIAAVLTKALHSKGGRTKPGRLKSIRPKTILPKSILPKTWRFWKW